MGIVDAHVHVWRLADARYDWIAPDEVAIRRDVALDELLPDLAALGVGGVVLVQGADDDGDTARLLATADRHPEVRGVVALIPLEVAGVAERIARRDPRVVGVRAPIGLTAAGHDPRVDRGLEALAEAALPLDVSPADPAPLAGLPALAARHPGLTLVLDHLGKPALGAAPAEFTRWRASLREVAAIPHAVAKLSGLRAAGPDPSAWSERDLRVVLDTALEAFGPERLMVGSDWPVCLLRGGPRRWWDAVGGWLSGVDDAARAAILGGTAERVYRLGAVPTTTDTRPARAGRRGEAA